MMLQKKERLTRDLFDRSFSVGKRMHTPYMQVIVADSSTFHGSVVVPKKVYKKAVDRNALRRRIYNVLYTHNKQKASAKTIIVIVKPTIVGVPRQSYASTLSELLENVRT
jgi:ribonuclease P protein component